MNQVNKVPLLGVWSWHSEKLGWLKCRNSVKSRGHYGRPWAKSTSREQKENGAGGQRHKRWAEPLQPLIPRGVTLISKFSVSKSHFPKDLWNVLCLDSMWVSVAYNKPPFFFFFKLILVWGVCSSLQSTSLGHLLTILLFWPEPSSSWGNKNALKWTGPCNWSLRFPLGMVRSGTFKNWHPSLSLSLLSLSLFSLCTGFIRRQSLSCW